MGRITIYIYVYTYEYIYIFLRTKNGTSFSVKVQSPKITCNSGPIWIHFIVSFHHFHHSFMELSTNQSVTKTGLPQGCSTLNPLHTLGISATCRLIGDDRWDSVGWFDDLVTGLQAGTSQCLYWCFCRGRRTQGAAFFLFFYGMDWWTGLLKLLEFMLYENHLKFSRSG